MWVYGYDPVSYTHLDVYKRQPLRPQHGVVSIPVKAAWAFCSHSVHSQILIQYAVCGTIADTNLINQFPKLSMMVLHDQCPHLLDNDSTMAIFEMTVPLFNLRKPHHIIAESLLNIWFLLGYLLVSGRT